MKSSEKHPTELTFQRIIEEVKNLFDKCENQYIDGSIRDALREDMETIRQKLFNLKIERLFAIINE